MGRHGTDGWQSGGPSPLCAWIREELGWLGPDNSQLVEIAADAPDLDLGDLQQGGTVYKIALPTYTLDDEPQEEYLLLEYRDPQASYYNRHQPAAGLLVWHVRPSVLNNTREEFKKVDLVCADGLYSDAGYPGGQQAAPRQGRDNLDFWAHDADYRDAHHGNSGDATDLFDGVRYHRLDLDTNPSTALVTAADPSQNGLSIALHRRGGRLRLDVDLPGDPEESPVSDDQAAADEAAPSAERPDLATAILDFDQETFTAQEPESFALLPNYPNPFGSQTTIPYQLAEACPVRVEIYNSLGQRVRILVDDFQSAGRQEIGWDGRDESGHRAATGVYLCRFEAEGRFSQARQLLRLPGYAQLSTIDSTLQGHGRQWDTLSPYLKVPATRLGYARQLSPERAAFAAGVAWTRLEAGAHYGGDPDGVADHIETLVDLLPHFGPAAEQTKAIQALLNRLQTDSPSAGSAATFDQTHWALDYIIGAYGDETALLFFAGKWLQRLQVAAQAARRLNVPLDQALDLRADAATSRYLGEALRLQGADGAIIDRCDALAAALEQPEIARLLDQLEELVTGLRSY